MDGFLAVLSGLRGVEGRARSRRNPIGRNRVNYPRLSRRLCMEPLEDRAMLSVSIPIGPVAPPVTALHATTNPPPSARPGIICYHPAGIL